MIMRANDLRRRLRAEIRAAAAVLRQEWDPIGRGQIEDLPADEYDSYAPHVVSLVQAGADDEAIADYLSQLESETIGASSGRDLRTVAARLRAAIAASSNRAT